MFQAQDVAVVYIPIVPMRLGDIDVTLHASTLIGKDQITRRLHVEVITYDNSLYFCSAIPNLPSNDKIN